MQEDINRKIRETLDSLNGMDRASAKPYFFTRLSARMNSEKNTWGRISSFVARPVVAFGCICFIIMINAAVIYSSEKNNTVTSGQNDEVASVDEYSQVSSNFYEFVNIQP